MTKHIYKTECVVCEAPVDDYEPQICCSGHMCGCMGMPSEPPICSSECFERLMGSMREEEQPNGEA